MTNKNEVSEFWDNIEAEYNARVCFKTYAILLGKSSDIPLNIAGLFYVVDHQVIFENLERGPSMFQFLTRKEKFQKYKIHFAVEDVLDVKEISKATSHRCIDGSMNHSETKAVGSYYRFFFKSICQIRLRPDYSLFFDVLDLKSLISFLKKHGSNE
jgi:hypothetical protein